jgi:hypothetical protein
MTILRRLPQPLRHSLGGYHGERVAAIRAIARPGYAMGGAAEPHVYGTMGCLSKRFGACRWRPAAATLSPEATAASQAEAHQRDPEHRPRRRLRDRCDSGAIQREV